MDVKVEKFQPYTNPRRNTRKSSGSISGGVGKMTLRSTSRISTSSDDVIVDTVKTSRSRRISSGLGDFEDYINELAFSAKKKVIPEEVVSVKVEQELESGVNGPLPGILTHVTSGTVVGTSGILVTVNHNSFDLVYWKLGSVNNASAYVFAKDDGTYDQYITSNGANGPLVFSPSDLADPMDLDVDNDDLTQDPRVFYLFSSGLLSGNQGHLFPSEFWADQSYSVQESANNAAFVLSHSGSADTFKID
uniref:Uncharacterized protein LOC100187150 n=1 Tax=Phallusia mammillata TaxID=59560 RepID=A0A6F9DHW3_9ASCI|nr:uncharacterized protein LOC100187150 [Phallusia mammillata]